MITLLFILICGLALILFVMAHGPADDHKPPSYIYQDEDTFEEAFPNRCYVCAYHAYGLREGFLSPQKDPVPQDHRCIEKWERWKGVLHGKGKT